VSPEEKHRRSSSSQDCRGFLGRSQRLRPLSSKNPWFCAKTKGTCGSRHDVTFHACHRTGSSPPGALEEAGREVASPPALPSAQGLTTQRKGHLQEWHPGPRHGSEMVPGCQKKPHGFGYPKPQGGWLGLQQRSMGVEVNMAAYISSSGCMARTRLP